MDSYNEKMNMPFTRGLALLRELLTIGTISARNCLFARKFIHEKMHPFFRDPESVLEMADRNCFSRRQKNEERTAKRRNFWPRPKAIIRREAHQDNNQPRHRNLPAIGLCLGAYL